MIVYQIVLEESKEADTTTGQATHRISKGIRDKVVAVTKFCIVSPASIAQLFVVY